MAVEGIEGAAPTFRWGAILAGSFVALGTWMFLYALGAAIGMTATRTTPGPWMGIYVLVAPILALFVGGLLAARARGIVSRADAILNALVIWGFCMTVGVAVLGSTGSLILATTPLQRVNLPAGYFWAVAGSILGSLVAVVLGATTGLRERVSAPERERREVYP